MQDTPNEVSFPFVIKRVLDIIFSLMLLPVVLPLSLIIACAIRWDSAGPVFFRQERRGYKFRKFTMFKFRTLKHNAPDPHEKYEMLETDPRVTRVGKWIRKTSLDELPQLWNVFIGDMSLVGPRPLVEWESRECLETHPGRFSMKPGITGLSQAYARNSVDLSARSDLDIAYVNSWSNLLDLKILFITPIKLVFMNSIYPQQSGKAIDEYGVR